MDDLPDYSRQYSCRERHGRGQGYHRRYLRALLASHCALPALAHSVLLEVNLRWNLRMMVKTRGLPAGLGGHYNEYLVELVQRATADWEPSCPVPRSIRPPSTQ